MAERDTSNGSVNSVNRAFEILSVMAAGPGHSKIGDIASQTGLPLPTVHRLLKTLEGLGHVRRLNAKGYALGAGLMSLGEAAARQFGASARPQLETLTAVLYESVNFAVLDSDMALYISQASSQRAMRMFVEVGKHVPLHNTGVGKALLAQLDPSRVAAIVARTGLPAATEHSIRTLAELNDELDQIRTRGYAIDEQEQEIGVRCLAVPVPGAAIPSALSVSGPVARMDADFERRAIPLLQNAAEAVAG
jgi:IclR family transcriptional regulator, acetate operon repressor